MMVCALRVWNDRVADHGTGSDGPEGRASSGIARALRPYASNCESVSCTAGPPRLWQRVRGEY